MVKMKTLDTSQLLLYTARVLGLLWAGFWLFFGIASAVGEELRLSGIMMHILFPGLVFLGIALLAWRWPNHGVFVFVMIGLFVLIGYPIMMKHFPLSTIIFVELTMALPPLIAGILLYVANRMRGNIPEMNGR
jgi:hypothetical protein